MLPLILSWAWNLQGGWLRVMGYYDRAGSIIIFHIGALGGMIGSIVAGPRYGRFMKSDDLKRVKGGGKMSI
jgi:Amt family ammonium transporter